jgi:hypothetical protein
MCVSDCDYASYLKKCFKKGDWRDYYFSSETYYFLSRNNIEVSIF